MVVLGGGAVSYERGTPVPRQLRGAAYARPRSQFQASYHSPSAATYCMTDREGARQLGDGARVLEDVLVDICSNVSTSMFSL